MDKTTKEDTIATLEAAVDKLKSDETIALFAVVATPAPGGQHHVRFLLYRQGIPGIGAAVALAVGKNAEQIFKEFDKWLRAAGFAPEER